MHENQIHKRRKVGEGGEYKTVFQKNKPGKEERTEREDEEEQTQGREKKRKKEDVPWRILGGVIKDH